MLSKGTGFKIMITLKAFRFVRYTEPSIEGLPRCQRVILSYYSGTSEDYCLTSY